MNTKSERDRLLSEWGTFLGASACNGTLLGGDPLPVSQIETICGPRAGALEIVAGLGTGKLLRTLNKDDCAMLRQFVPWSFQGEPACFLSGRFVRVEAGWPDDLAERDIKLADLGQHPKDGGRWIAGKSEMGQTVTVSVNDASPHWLFSGTTGSGKSYAMRAAVSQLCRDPGNKLILLDGKFGEGLQPLAQVPNLIGPLAKDTEMARLALSWAVGEMRRRYETPNRHDRLILVIDEVQEVSSDTQCAEFLRRLVTQGRGAKVHCVLGTQHPTVSMFGDNNPAVKRNLPGRLALKTLDAKSSEVAVGAGQPRADHLLGAGDAYAIVPGKISRTQLAYVPERELGDLPHGEPTFAEWPAYNAECAGTLPEKEAKWEYTGTELAISLVSAHQEEGRRKLLQALQAEGYGAGNVRADRLLDLGREGYQWLRANGWTLAQWQNGDVPMCLDAEHTQESTWEAFLGQFECV